MLVAALAKPPAHASLKEAAVTMIRALALAPLAGHVGPSARVASPMESAAARAPALVAVRDALVTAATLVAHAQARAAPSKPLGRVRRGWSCTLPCGSGRVGVPFQDDGGMQDCGKKSYGCEGVAERAARECSASVHVGGADASL